MTVRELPTVEYYRLDGTELEVVWPLLPEGSVVMVVEDDHGDIVACWAAFQRWHIEGCWVAPAHRGKAGVARTLLRGMAQTLRRMGAPVVATAATTDLVRDLLAKLGAQKLPGDHYVLSLE